MKIERIYDLTEIKALATHPAIYDHISDDYFPEPKEWNPEYKSDVVYLLASDDHGVFGFGIFMPRRWSLWESHFGFLPRSSASTAITAYQKMFDWMWEHTKAQRIVGEICAGNSKAVRFALMVGAEIYGVNHASLLKHGRLHDQICLGVSKWAL